MADPKRRNIHYLRPRWGRIPAITFEDGLRACLDGLPTGGNTIGRSGEGMSAAILHRETVNGSFCLHIGTWMDGEEASTVRKTRRNRRVSLGIQPPPEDAEYLVGDGMVLVSGNHCLLMPSRMRTAMMKRYLNGLMAFARGEGLIPDGMEAFELLPIVRETVVEQIREEGVSSVHLNLGQYMETAVAGAEDAPQSLMVRVANAIREQFEGPLTREQMLEAANLNVGLSVSLDRRYKRRGTLVPEDLARLGEEIASEAEADEDVVIETGSGQKIRRGELALTKGVDVAAYGQTVRHEDAWQAMGEYLAELEASGALEE